MEFDHFTVLLLWQGDAADALDEHELATLQDGHLAHLAQLHEAGVLLAAGPAIAASESALRGFGLFNVLPAEAERLMNDDPSVRAGRFRTEFVPWMVPAGAMSFAPTRFPRSIAEARGA
jgi:uncharacterized protein YciI